MSETFMIYGANGYTGELIAREAKARGLSPVLAARSRHKLEPLANELGFDCRAFELKDPEEIAHELHGVAVVLHCAGPFSATSAPMIEGCLLDRVHYLDISGEISVYEHAYAQHARAQEAGVVICPGVGFDVIPTDCLAAALKQALPDATHLALGFDSRSGMSPGTAKTSVEGLAQGCKVRRDGTIVTVPLAWKVRTIDFGDGEKPAMTIPWGDVATAYYSTGIPNIEVYMPAPPRMIANARRANYLRWLLGLPLVQNAIKRRIQRTVKGPDQHKRGQMPAHVWGEARNAKGEVKSARIRTANGYSLTVTGSLAVTQYLLNHHPRAGYYTPSKLMGADLVTTLPESGPMVLS